MLKASALGTEYVQRKEPVAKVEFLKKRKVFGEFQDHNEHFQMLTKDITPVSVNDNICLKCRENVINTVSQCDFLRFNFVRFLCHVDMHRYVKGVWEFMERKFVLFVSRNRCILQRQKMFRSV